MRKRISITAVIIATFVMTSFTSSFGQSSKFFQPEKEENEITQKIKLRNVLPKKDKNKIEAEFTVDEKSAEKIIREYLEGTKAYLANEKLELTDIIIANYYVSASGNDSNNGLTPETAFATIQHAIDLSSGVDTIYIMPGTYNERLNITTPINLIGLSGNPEDVIIDAQLLGRVINIVTFSQEIPVTIEAVTIQGGLASDQSNPYTVNNWGGGIFSYDSSLVLNHSIIKNNSAAHAGGGIAVLNLHELEGDHEIATLSDVLIKENLTTNLNSTLGAGISIYSSLTLENTALLNMVTIVNNSHNGVKCIGTGAFLYNADTTLANCLVANNSNKTGPAVFVEMSTPVKLINSTIASNSSQYDSEYSPGIHVSGTGTITALNSILWGNESSGSQEIQMSLNHGTCSIAYSDLQFGIEGISIANNGEINWLDGNKGENIYIDDPLFVDINSLEIDGLSIQDGSPCAGTGTNAYMFPEEQLILFPPCDITSNTRPLPQGSMPDMGAYEIEQADPVVFEVLAMVLDENNEPIEGATVNGEDVSLGTVWFEVIEGGSITLTPFAEGYIFVPPFKTLENITENTGQFFLGIPEPIIGWDVNISGTVLDPLGQPIPDATLEVNVNGTVNDIDVSSGSYSITVDNGSNVTLAPEMDGYIFMPPSVSFTDVQSDVTQDFLAMPIGNVVTQQIQLNTGWNIISFNILPENMDLEDILAPVIGLIEIVQDDHSGTIWPAYSINTIGQMSINEGYKVKMSGGMTLTVTGSAVTLPVTLTLDPGWNTIGFPSQVEQNAESVLQPLIDSGVFIQAVDENDNTLNIINGDPVNEIGNFKPGKGYNVKVSAGCSLTI